MLFTSSVFIFLFLPVVLFFYYVVFKKSRLWQNIFLFVASLLFYAWGEPAFVFVMLASICANYGFGLLVGKVKSKNKKAHWVVALSVVFNLSILFVFKYLAFTMGIIKELTNGGFSIPSIALPIGISFFTFQAMSYVIDVYRGDGEVQKNPLNVGLYIAFFPQLIAGPIVRYQTIADQIQNRKESFEDFSYGIRRFVLGLAKKVLIANTLALVADNAFATDTSQLSVSFAWLGALAYTFQIFFDFSGYSDMAIGLGKMFGFHFLENFNYPYISKSISEFWRRWHISLGTWFRDYVYFPLGGSRVKHKSRLVFNLFIVWSLTGIWHGANWTFIIWGLLYFVLLTVEKLTSFDKKFNKLPVLKHIYTLLFVVLGWVIFKSTSMEQAINYIGAMFGSSGILVDNVTLFSLTENIFYFVFAIICSTPIIKILVKKLPKNNIIIEILLFTGLGILLLLSIIYIVKSSYNPFIYFNF